MNDIINYNGVSNATYALKNHNKKIDETLQKLSSGHKNIVGDDIVNDIQISQHKNNINAYTAITTSLNNNQIMLSTAYENLSQQQNIVNDIINSIQLSKLENDENKQTISKDIESMFETIDHIANEASYNDTKLLNGELENKKINRAIHSYQDIPINIQSTDTSKVATTRFETGKIIKKDSEVALEIIDKNDNEINLPKVIISHSANTGIGKLARMINENSNLDFTAFFKVQSKSRNKMFLGNIHNLTINDVKIGDISIKKADEYQAKLIDVINKKSEQTGVVATLVDNNKLQLDSKDGRGIVLRATSGISLLNMSDEYRENYGQITLVSYKQLPVNIKNPTQIGFDQRSIKNIALDYFTKGNFTPDDVHAIGLDDSIRQKDKVDLRNNIFSKHLLAISDNLLKKLEKQKQNIISSQTKIRSALNSMQQKNISSKIGLSNLQDIDYSKEILNNTKYKILSQSAAYSITNSLDFSKKLFNILFENFKTK